jgi:tetratricopeptide (TPR) repeat protein
MLLGCKKVDQKKTPVPPVAVEHSQKHGQSLNPDYFGLIEEYRTMLKNDPHNLAVIIALGNAYYDNRSWSDAIRLYEQALRLDPPNADVHTDMGTAYRNMGRPDRALAEYHLALDNDPGHVDARYNMGVVYAFDMKHYDVAIHLWEELLQLAPNYPHADDIRTFILTFRKALQRGGT